MTAHRVASDQPAPRSHRTAHCRRIGAHGGALAFARHGTHLMRVIGTASAHATIRTHGVGYWRGLVDAKGWRGRRPVSLAVDLAAGRADAALAA